MTAESVARTNLARALTSPVAATIVLIVFYLLMLASVGGKSATFDEPGHATAGYTYWKFNDFRIDPENGNLPQRWMALPLLFVETKFPSTEDPAWRDGDLWLLSNNWFFRSGNNAPAMVAKGRAVAAIWAVALGAIIWLWSRRLFGPAGGMLSLVVYALNPSVLGNGPLMTSDLPATFFFFAALACFHCMLERYSIGRVLASALVLSGLFVTKMSAMLILPVIGVMAVARCFDRRPLVLGSHWELARVAQRALALSIGAVVHLLVILFVVWACYGFRFSAFASGDSLPGHFKHPWQWVLDQPTPQAMLQQLPLSPGQKTAVDQMLNVRRAQLDTWTNDAIEALASIRAEILTSAQREALHRIETAPPPHPIAMLAQFARTYRILPEAYVYGNAYVWRRSTAQAQFFNGEFRLKGSLLYFPFMFLVKTPLPTLALLLLSGTTILAGWRSQARRDSAPLWRTARTSLYATLPLWLFAAVYCTAAIASRINIGHRHFLPVYPAMFVLCGGATSWLGTNIALLTPKLSRVARLALGGLVGVLVLEFGFRWPNFLAYFNGIVRPENAYRRVVDSSLDWGQDLPAIREFIQHEAPGQPIYLSYFGVASPQIYGVQAKALFSHPGHDRGEFTTLKILGNATPRLDDPVVADFLQRHPEYDQNLIGAVSLGNEKGALLVKRAAELRLAAGTYLVSASMLQPVFYERALGPWSASDELRYRQVRESMRPFFADDRPTRTRFFTQGNIFDVAAILEEFDQLRFARLTAYLRKRSPDDNINYTILVFRLTAEEVALATEGPSP